MAKTNEFEAAVINCVTALAEAFGRKATPVTINAYRMGLEGLDPQRIARATARALRECEFMPPPAKLRELGGEIRLEDRAEMAWLAVTESIPLGPYKHVNFDDGISNAVIRGLGGWPNFIERFSDPQSEGFARRDFIASYQRLVRCHPSDEACAPLPGLAEGTILDRKAYLETGRFESPEIVPIETGLPKFLPTLSHKPDEPKRLPIALPEIKRP